MKERFPSKANSSIITVVIGTLITFVIIQLCGLGIMILGYD